MRKIIISLFFAILSWGIYAQNTEHYLKIYINDRTELETLTLLVSIDNVRGNEVIAFANEEQFEYFITLNIPYEILTKPVLTPEELNMLDFEAIKNCRNDWNYYPDYQAYLDLMDEFVTNYPNLCRKVEFGTSVQNRKLWALVLSNNVHVREPEPQVFWTSSMHGDELTGYVLMLRYIDYLLSNYGTDERVTYLLDNMEIWVNPLANPDGTFKTGNSSVSGAIRYNANNVDLNRNYYGNNPNAWQKETRAFIEMQAEETFVLACNIHGGAELFNYTWDKNCTLPADNTWWKMVGNEYVDTVHSQSTSYFTGEYCNYCSGQPSGYLAVVNGASWYPASDTRQDYANYYNYTREVCLEISNTKTPTASQLPIFWNRNHRSFLNFTEQALYGIHGVVTDACSGEPVYAKIFINGHDVDNVNDRSFVMTDPRVGYYARLIKGGTHSVTYSAEGYVSQTVSIAVEDRQQIVKNIVLTPTAPPTLPPVADFTADHTIIDGEETMIVHFTDLSTNCPDNWLWYFEGGTPETSTERHPVISYEGSIGKSLSFDVKLLVSNGVGIDSIMKEDYIIVLPNPPVANFEADITEIFENCTVNFIDLSEHATAWEWYFEGADTETSIEQNPTVLYKNHGNFDVKLKVMNDAGSDELLKDNYITVKQIIIPPAANFEADATEIFENETVRFIDLSENATAWEWYFEGGTPETTNEQNPVVLYENFGAYNVKLTVTNEGGSDELLKENYIVVKGLAVLEREGINVKIFPNPVSQETNITINADEAIYKIELINLLGAIVKTNYPDRTPYTISVSGIEKGIYFMRIETQKGDYTTKIQIQ